MRRHPPAYFRPTTLDEALDLWREMPEACFLAGGTVLMGTPLPPDRPVIDVLSLAETQAFGPVILPGDRAGWRLGAALSWQAALRPDLPPGLRLWRTVAEGFASPAVRAAATVGGSIMLPDTGDARVALLACDGHAHFLTIDGIVRDAVHPPADGLLLHLDMPVPDYSLWVGIGLRGERRDRAGLSLAFDGDRCRRLHLARRIGAAPAERWTAAEAAAAGTAKADLPDRLRPILSACPLGRLLLRQLAREIAA